jgi:hypothetical protein
MFAWGVALKGSCSVSGRDPGKIEVHPAFHNKNLLTILNGREIDLAPRHAKVRRDGYRCRN